MMTDAGAGTALPWLHTHPSLNYLDIGENILTDASCEFVARVIETVPVLQTLLLRGFLFEPRRISDSGGQIVARAVAKRSSMASSSAFESSSHRLGTHPPLELELDYQQVGCQTATTLASCAPCWRRLSLFNTNVSTMGAMALANSFRQGPPGCAATVRLNVAQCRIGAGAVQLLRTVGFARLDSHGQRQAAAIPE